MILGGQIVTGPVLLALVPLHWLFLTVGTFVLDRWLHLRAAKRREFDDYRIG